MRLLKGLAALAALVVMTVGIPVALVLLGQNPFPDRLSWAAVSAALLRRDDGTLLLGVITAIGWLAWCVFALSLLTELVHVASGSRIRIRLPGLGGSQRLVAGLLLTVLAMLAVPTAASATPGATPAVAATAAAPAGARTHSFERPQGAPAVVEQTAGAGKTPQVTSAQTGEKPLTHRVQRGDDLWSLAEHYYGQGREWRKIAAANPDRLTGGPDRLQPGWELTIPDQGLIAPRSASVTVHDGDTLSSIAERVYGREDRWTDIFEANRAQIEDPDEIDVGAHLRLPDISATRPPGAEPPLDRAEPGETTPGSGTTRPKPEAGSPETRPRAKAPAPDQDPASAGTRKPSTSTPGSRRPSAPTEAPEPAGRATGQQPSGPVVAPASQAPSHPALEVVTVGGLLAASVLAGLALRRRVQLQARPVGRRIVHPPPQAQALETALGQRHGGLDPDTLDLALRALAAHCHQAGVPLPSLALVRMKPERIELQFHGSVPAAPVGFQPFEHGWLLEPGDTTYLASVPGVMQAARPYPALVTLGQDDGGYQLLVDLEAVGLMALESDDPQLGQAMLAAMAVELSFAPWGDELALNLVGDFDGLSDAVDKHNVTRTDAVDDLLARLEHRADTQRAQVHHEVLGQNRVDPDLADPWTPEVLLVSSALTEEQNARLTALGTKQPRVTVAAVVLGPLPAATWALTLSGDRTEASSALVTVVRPLGATVRPQLLTPPVRSAVVELVAATGSEATTAAPWWAAEADFPADPPPDNVTHLGKRFGGWGSEQAADTEESGIVVQQPEEAVAGPHHPILRMLGPIELLGAAGTPPPRAGKQCLEYCGWLLEHPGTSAQAMAAALVVAEGTRRSNMSRLRSWLGADEQGQPYLPDAYTGRILLHPSVSSDWQRLQILTGGGVNRTSIAGLRASLELVRGAPLADAAPGQWHWAEELRTDMISAVRDIGVELTSRALDDGNLDLARWAASRALVAAPGDELLLAARIRTEHQAGNVAETERLTLQLAAQSRALGVDLEDETVTLLQEVMEGRVRARLA